MNFNFIPGESHNFYLYSGVVITTQYTSRVSAGSRWMYLGTGSPTLLLRVISLRCKWSEGLLIIDFSRPWLVALLTNPRHIPIKLLSLLDIARFYIVCSLSLRLYPILNWNPRGDFDVLRNSHLKCATCYKFIFVCFIIKIFRN